MFCALTTLKDNADKNAANVPNVGNNKKNFERMAKPDRRCKDYYFAASRGNGTLIAKQAVRSCRRRGRTWVLSDRHDAMLG
jgi:hypothetical protein